MKRSKFSEQVKATAFPTRTEAHMHLSRIQIVNFRNFAKLDVKLTRNVVVVGENRVGKSNLLHALRLLLDPTLPDSARQPSQSDFWDGLQPLDGNHTIIISADIQGFEADINVLALLTDFRLHEDPETARLT